MPQAFHPSRRLVRRALFPLLWPLCAVAGEPQGLDYAHQGQWPRLLDHAQSPIDIVTASAIAPDPSEPASIRVHNHPVNARVGDNGHAVEVDGDAADAMIRGRHFRLTQFHFHSPSEHSIDGRHFPLEGHYVFRAVDGRLAVIAVLYTDGRENAALTPVLRQLEVAEQAPVRVDVTGLMPRDFSYYHYLGSLTTPPLSENVEWYVLSQPVSLSTREIAKLHARHPRNNRDRQPMHDRPLVHFVERP